MLRARDQADLATRALAHASARVAKAVELERLVHARAMETMRAALAACRRCEALQAALAANHATERGVCTQGARGALPR